LLSRYDISEAASPILAEQARVNYSMRRVMRERGSDKFPKITPPRNFAVGLLGPTAIGEGLVAKVTALVYGEI
jgi:hypothetical protein